MMSKYLVTYFGSGMPSDPALMQQAKEAFGKWLSEAGSAVVDPGAPLKYCDQVATGNPVPKVEIGGYSIIQAESVDDVKKLLQSHPFVGRGGTLQIDEVMAV